MKNSNHEEEVSRAIEEFYSFLEKYPDEQKSLSNFTQFIRKFLRIYSADKPLPTIEIMTILKHKKPLVFSLIRKETNNFLFQILTNVDMELEEAEDNLRKFMKEGQQI